MALALSSELWSLILSFNSWFSVVTVRKVCRALKKTKAAWEHVHCDNEEMLGLCVPKVVREIDWSKPFIEVDLLDHQVAMLSCFTGLENLNLYGSNLSVQGFAHVGALASLKQLRLSHATDIGLACLVPLERLESLDLHNCSLLTGQGVAHLARLNLTNLKLEGCDCVDDDSVGFLAEISTLRTLDISSSDITGTGLKKLQSLRLEALDISHCRKIASGDFSFAASLLILNLSYTLAADSDLHGLPNLTSLRLETCNITDRALELVAKITTLQSLNVYNCVMITDDGLAHLANTRLKGVNLAFCKHVTDKGLAELAQIPTLTRLNVDCCKQVGDVGVSHFNNLTKLNVANTRVSNKGLEDVGRMAELEVLYLDECNIDDAGLGLLVGLKNLNKLSLSGTAVTNRGLQWLPHFPFLQDLRLAGCAISFYGLRPLQKLKELKILNVSSCGFACKQMSELGLENLDLLLN